MTKGTRFKNLRRLKIRVDDEADGMVHIILKNASGLRDLSINYRLPVVGKDGKIVTYPRLEKLECQDFGNDDEASCPALTDLKSCLTGMIDLPPSRVRDLKRLHSFRKDSNASQSINSALDSLA